MDRDAVIAELRALVANQAKQLERQAQQLEQQAKRIAELELALARREPKPGLSGFWIARGGCFRPGTAVMR